MCCYADKFRLLFLSVIWLCESGGEWCGLPVAVEMHAAHGGRVSVQSVHTLPALCVPHAQRPVCGAADHRGDSHLAAPHPAGVTRQRLQTLDTRKGEALEPCAFALLLQCSLQDSDPDLGQAHTE